MAVEQTTVIPPEGGSNRQYKVDTELFPHIIGNLYLYVCKQGFISCSFLASTQDLNTPALKPARDVISDVWKPGAYS